MSHSRFFQMVIVTCVILFASFSPTGIVIAQVSIEDVGREVIVMFRSNSLELREGDTQSTVEQLAVVEPAIRELLTQHGVDRIRMAFPEFNLADTLRVTREGITVRSMDLSRVFVLRLPSYENRDSVIARLQRLPSVAYAEQNATGHARFDPNDQYFGVQWGMKNAGQSGGTPNADIKATLAWDIFTGTSNVTIGIVDVGRVQQNHPEFSSRVSGNLTATISSHSTHVAGIAAARGNNISGVAGVDWNALINTQTIGVDIPVQAAAVRASVDAGAQIINNSWGQGNNNFSITAKQAFVYAFQANVSSVNAMPATYSTDDYPNAYGQGIINVGATTNTDAAASYTVQRSYVDVAAPGGDGSGGTEIYSTLPTNAYGYLSGTSMAAPHVAGIASLLKGYNSILYNDDIENILKLSADKVRQDLFTYDSNGWNIEVGYGRINAHKALLLANSVQHASVTGGSSIGFVGGHRQFYGVSGLTDGYNYLTERHEVRASVTFSPAFQDAPSVWGRGAATTGFNGEVPNFGVGFCEPVPGTITTTGAQLRTYVYDVWVPDINSPDGKGQYMGRFPADFPSVVLAYSKIELPSPAVPPAPQSLVVTNHGQGGQNPQLSWQYSPLSDFDHYNIYRKYESEQNFSLIGTSGSTAYTDLGTTLSSTWFPSVSYYVTAVNQQSAESDPSNTATTGGEPSKLGGENAFAQLIPDEYSLLQNYPNPFNPETEIVYGLPEPSDVRIVISDILGRELLTLEEAHQTAGYHRKRWSGVDAAGEKLGSGVYLLRIVAKGETGKQFSQVLKLVLTK